MIQTVSNKHLEIYRTSPALYKAPGRINLIGEHTDYNEGFVLPAAIDRSIVFGVSPNKENRIRLHSMDFGKTTESSVTEPSGEQPQWARYLLGVVEQFRKAGITVRGFDCTFGGNIPLGAGMSSSAALECGMAVGLNDLWQTGFSKWELVKMAQKAEHESVGVLCGIMDQYSSVFGQKDSVIQLDCRTNTHEYYPLKMEDSLIALVDTGVKHELASSEYNIRRRECEEGVGILRKNGIAASSLRDSNPGIIEQFKDQLGPVLFRRCNYVTRENERVLKACKALLNNDMKAFGDLMYASHEGLKTDYEVSCKELDTLVDLTRAMDYVHGARMMGGGFGGCTINLLEKSSITTFLRTIKASYQAQTGLEPPVYFIEISDGASRIEL